MKKILITLISFVFFLFSYSVLFSQLNSPNTLKQLHEEMLYPTVRVRAETVGGSGTVVWSAKDSSGSVHTFVITNHHVVEELIKVDKKWNSIVKKETMQEMARTCQVEVFKYNNFSYSIGQNAIEADVVAYSHVAGGQDWALLELRDKENILPYVAKLYPRNEINNIHVFDEVYAIGAALGHAPLATKGNITFMSDEIDNYQYWMSTANSIFGNSGGAVFRYSDVRKVYEFIGIPSRITVLMSGFSAVPITYMGYFIPIDRIYNLLEANYYQFIYDSSYIYEQCNELRERMREKELEKE